jgi:RND superfamily putative drug exporter
VRPFARWIVTHKKIVAAVWAVIAVVAFAAVQPASDALSSEFSLPGRDSTEANQLIFERFGNGGTRVEGPIVLVAQVPEGRSLRDPAVRREVGQAFGAVTQAIPGSRAANLATTGDDLFVGRDGRTTFGVVWYPPAATAFDAAGPALEQARAAAARVQVAGAPVKVTGIEALAAGSGASEGPNVLIEVLIGGLFALIVLAVVFGSLMALVPLLMAAIAIPTTFLALWPIAEVSQVSIVVQFLVALIGLGVAIDYSLLIVMRWREERGAGRTNREAVIESMEHAGRAVIFSGIAVAIGLLALVALPVPFLRSIGYGGMLIPLVSTLVAVTLLPAMLDAWGPALDRIGFKRRTQSTQDGWVPWGRFVVRHRWLVGGAAFAILLVFMGPVINFTTGVPRAEALSASGPAREALDTLSAAGIGEGVLRPYEITAQGTDPGAVASAAAGVGGIRGAVAPDGPEWRQGDLAVVNAFSDAETPGQTLDDLRDAVAAVPGEQVLVGGSIAGNADFNEAVYGNFIWVLLAILIVTYILLARSLRSLILPLKAVLFNIMSILAVWGFLVFFWQQGNGSGLIFGIEPTGALTVWIPLMVFAFLYGLSMDYEVFILSRMREEYDRVPSTDRAVVLGIARTGRLVTAGSLILFGAFIALASGPETDVKVFATALAVGIILDATIIRGALLPAFVAVLGRWNWWLPVWAARILRVEPSLPAPETLTGHDVDLGAPARPVPGTPAPDAT